MERKERESVLIGRIYLQVFHFFSIAQYLACDMTHHLVCVSSFEFFKGNGISFWRCGKIRFSFVFIMYSYIHMRVRLEHVYVYSMSYRNQWYPTSRKSSHLLKWLDVIYVTCTLQHWVLCHGNHILYVYRKDTELSLYGSGWSEGNRFCSRNLNLTFLQVA